MLERHLDDERLTALLDAPSGSARVARDDAHLTACTACSDRFDALAAARAAVAESPTPLAAGTVDRLVARALEAAGDAPIVDLGTRRRTATPPGAWIVAAAAVLLLILAIPAALRVADGEDQTVASREAAPETTDELSVAPSAGRAATGGASGEVADSNFDLRAGTAAATAGAAGPPHLGPVATEQELVQRLVAALSTGQPRTEASGAGAEPAPCEAEARRVGAGRVSDLAYRAALVWQGRDAVVVVFSLTEPANGQTRQAYVMAPEGCAVLAEPRF